MASGENSTIVHQIQWHDGMALLPHHFQQLDLRLFQMIVYNMNLVSNYHWGVQELRIDKLCLPDGLLRILNAKVVMPDGLIFHFTSNEDAHSRLELDLHSIQLPADAAAATVQLILPARIDGISPIRSVTARFQMIDGPTVIDENTDDNPISIPRLIPCFSLYAGEKLPQKHVGFPIAKIQFVDGSFVLSQYTPPCFYINNDSHLLAKCVDMTRKIREKAQALSEKWQNQVGTSLLRETAEMLKPLVAIMPSLESIIGTGDIAPFVLYSELMKIAGFIAQLNLSSVPPRFSKYNHNDIDNCVIPIVDYIMQCIDHLSLEYAIFPFKKNDRVFSFKLNTAYFQSMKEIFVGLHAKPGIQTKQIEIWMNEAIIVSDDALQKVQTIRVTGASRNLISGDVLYELSPPRDIILFSITLDTQFISPNRYLHIFNPSDSEYYRPADIVLYVPKDAQSALFDAA
ncbi:MAG: type VI secretion system baseplate subunit TssK [Holosporales bacterium]|jgi:type VI secretion system protein ImpJ|nr:type VI secretion system baseplate subunit TssK [Holosporales bacterium]